ncbi:MAG: Lrp/AsnC family transcriptional regulator [Thermoproteota archaeon]|nr:Lrp/AsnC family transcriptional regulator [Candidatus Brockarchaeota archaeon]MBO3762623.1 Lrp/AsnC family transcriptional regulator [Candidatus Brockarchaeota archaeon]MBO3768382.1 Lrp/AsnC family transcriptional regulator [Candidatus Brockarchaeota archaeon]MBO3800784.1 Lrp/AsnC family transcriptional regulator [Candidatus Brockarchaeota archaeon]
MIDEKDEVIISALRQDSNKPISRLSKEIGIPRATLQDRINKLVKQGIIKKFTIIPDFGKLGRPVTAFVMVSFHPSPEVSQRELAKQIATLPEVEEVHLISGEWDILVKIRVKDVESAGSFVIDKIRSMKGVEKTETCVSFECVKEGL